MIVLYITRISSDLLDLSLEFTLELTANIFISHNFDE